MKKIILILSVFLFGHASYAQEQYSDSLLCSSIYFIASGAYGDDKQAGEMMMGLQKSYELIYISNQNKRVTNGEIFKLKHEHLVYLGKLYDNKPSNIYELEMQCNHWREIFGPKLYAVSQTAKNEDEIKAVVKTIPSMSKESYSSSDPRWKVSKNMMDIGFKVWSDHNRITPYLFQENLKKNIQ